MSINIALKKTESFENLLKLVIASHEDCSFWYGRYIIVEGFNGKLSIDDFAIRLFALVKNNIDFDELDREVGRQIVHKIDHIYSSNEARWKHKNFFIYLFIALKDFFLSSKWNTRLMWELKHGELIFKTYTKNQFYSKYGYLPKHPPQWIGCNYPDRWATHEK